MPYYLRGNLWGYICRECPRPLWGVVLRVYEAEGERLIERAVADPKQTTAAVDEKAVKARAGSLLGEARVGEDGSYEIEFDKKSRYRGGPVDIEMRVEGLAHLHERAPEAKPRQIHITTLQPAFRAVGDERVAYWEYYLSARIWCLILSWFDIWVICGRVTICGTDKAVGGLTVEARDVDWVQQDYLGSAITDGAGRFVIYYPGAAFRHGTWIDIELTGGPDLFFTIKAPGGTVLLSEPPSRGRLPDRENIGNCFCVNLCVKDAIVDDGLAVFTHVGKYIHAVDIESGLTQSGLTRPSSLNSSDVRAFFHTMRLHGILPRTLGGHALEYCFEWREVDATGTNVIHPWTEVTQSQIARTVIGSWNYFDGATWDNRDYTVNGTAGPHEKVASFNGNWIRVPQENSLTSPAGCFTSNGNQINLISQSLVPFGSFNMTGKDAGLSAAPLGANRYFGLRMKARTIVGPQGPSAGLLDKIAINNKGYDNLKHHPSWAGYTSPAGTLGVNLLDIQELKVNGCAGIKTSLTPLVTTAHPTMGGVSLGIIGGNASTVAGGGPAVFTVPSTGLPGQRFGTATFNFTVTDLKPCAYILTLSTEIMLTTGDSNAGSLVDQMAFCKAPTP